MLLSIIVPVYNVEKYLRRCLNSIISDCSCYEIILVDDGSKDDSSQICDEFEIKFDYIKVIHQINGGLSDARNTGLKNAQGEYVFFLDSDDYLGSEAVPDLLECIRKNDGVDIITLSSYYIKEGIVTMHSFFHTASVKNGKDFLLEQYSCKTMQIPAWQNVYKREFLIRNDFIFKKGILHEDVQWTPRVFYKAESVSCCKLAVYYYEIRDNSISTAKDLSKNIKDFRNTVIELVDYFKVEPNKRLYRLIKDDLVKSYLSLYARGMAYDKGSEYQIPYGVLCRDLFYYSTYFKAALYYISPRLFCLIMNKYVFKK